MPDYPNLNYIGSSGFGPLPGGGFGRQTMLPTNQSTPRTDYAVLRSDGVAVSILTGQPFNGRDPHSGQMYSGGKLTAASTQGVQVPFSDQTINPNDPTQRYKPVNVVKQPDVAAGQQDLMKTFTDAAGSALKDFNQYLAQFKQGTGQAFQAGQKAADVTPTVNALSDSQRAYATSLGATQAGYAGLLGRNAAAERGIVQQATDILPQYDLAAQAIGDRQLAALQQQQARYKMGTGTPSSLGGADAAILARAVADVNLPLQEQRIARSYNLLQGLALPVQQDITNRGTQFLGQFNPAIANQIYSSAQGTTQQIQALRQIASQFGYQNALQYMQSIGVPEQIRQQVLSGQIGQLGQLSSLESMSNYQGLQDVLGYQLPQPYGYLGVGGAYPNYPPRPPLQTGGTGAAPIQVGPQYPGTATGTFQGPPPPGAYGVDAFGRPQYPGYAPPRTGGAYLPAPYSGYGDVPGVSNAEGVFQGDVNPGPVYG